MTSMYSHFTEHIGQHILAVLIAYVHMQAKLLVFMGDCCSASLSRQFSLHFGVQETCESWVLAQAHFAQDVMYVFHLSGSWDSLHNYGRLALFDDIAVQW